jgi:hypothetical protein
MKWKHYSKIVSSAPWINFARMIISSPRSTSYFSIWIRSSLRDMVLLTYTSSGWWTKIRRYCHWIKSLFKMFWCKSLYSSLKGMLCTHKELVTNFEEHKALWPIGYQLGYRDYINTILNNDCAVDMETATKNHLCLNYYKWCSKYIQKLHPKSSKGGSLWHHAGHLWWEVLW